MLMRLFSFLPQLTRRDTAQLCIILAIVVPILLAVRAWRLRKQRRALDDLLGSMRRDSDEQKQRIRDVLRRAEERQERLKLEAEEDAAAQRAKEEQKVALRDLAKDDAALSTALNDAGMELDEQNPEPSDDADSPDRDAK